MVRNFLNRIEIRSLDDKTDDLEDALVPFIWGVIVLSFVFIILLAVVTILFE